MADRRRTSETQMADLNAQLNDQNNTLRAMLKVGNDTEQITNNVQGELYRQRGVLENNVEKVHFYISRIGKLHKDLGKLISRLIKCGGETCASKQACIF